MKIDITKEEAKMIISGLKIMIEDLITKESDHYAGGKYDLLSKAELRRIERKMRKIEYLKDTISYSCIKEKL